MQGSVHRFDPDRLSGEVILDDGRVLTLPASALAESGLLSLRVGQRLSLDVSGADPSRIERAWIVGIGAGEAIT